MNSYNEGDLVINTITNKLEVVVDVLPQNKYLTVPLKGEESPTETHTSWLKHVRKGSEEDVETAGRILAGYKAEKEQRSGLYEKYTVIRMADNRPSATAMFVLDRRDPAAFMALAAYAESTSSYQLRQDIISMMEELMEKNDFKLSKAVVSIRDMEIRLAHLKTGD
jgi:hypothetical protein